jgi:hypothetical protein
MKELFIPKTEKKDSRHLPKKESQVIVESDIVDDICINIIKVWLLF